MPSLLACAGAVAGIVALAALSNASRPPERRVLPMEWLWGLLAAAIVNLAGCAIYRVCARPAPSKARRVLVVGCGAVGSVVGFHLARGGAQVAFLVRPERAESLAGLRLERLGLCTCRKGGAALIKQVEWVGFDLLTSVLDCCGPLTLRGDSPNQPAKPFDVVIFALSAAAARADAAALKRLVGGVGRECAIVRVIGELGEDRFFHETLGVHHTQLVDLGVGFMGYAAPLEDRGRHAACVDAFGYVAASPMLLSGTHPAVEGLLTALNLSELGTVRVPSVRGALVLPNAVLLAFVASLETAGWQLDALAGSDEAVGTLCEGIGEALDIGTASTEGVRREGPCGWGGWGRRCAGAALRRRWGARLALWAARPGCSQLALPIDLELFLAAHFKKQAVAEQTRLFLREYTAAAQEQKLPAQALRRLSAALPQLQPARATKRAQGSAGAGGKRRLVVGTSDDADGPSGQEDAMMGERIAEMSIRELKQLCVAHGLDTQGCVERADLVAVAQAAGFT